MPYSSRPLPTRLYLGITDHFPARRSEWVLAAIMVGWGWLLIRPEAVFAGNPAWRQMAALMDESTWGWLAISIGAFRLLALVINGTFARTWYGRWSPHVRAFASFLACFLWFQIAFGLWASDAATTGLAIYPGLLVLDAMNIVAASKDAAGMDKAVADDRP
jgi:hypothetical protein